MSGTSCETVRWLSFWWPGAWSMCSGRRDWGTGVCSALRRWLWRRPYCSLPLSMGKLMKRWSQLQGTRIANWSGIFWENIKIRKRLWGKLCVDNLPKEALGALFSEVFKAQVDQALCNITWSQGWAYFEQEAADFPRSLPTWTVLFSDITHKYRAWKWPECSGAWACIPLVFHF